HPKVRVEVSAGGSGKGMDDALNGLVDIGMVSRAIDSSEIDRGAYPIAVAKGAVVPTVNSRNPALKEILSKGIKRKTFADIYINGSVKTWGEVANRPEITDGIHVYTRSDAAGAAEVWAEYLGGRQEGRQENLRGTGVPGDPDILAAVQKDTLSIGFNNYNYAFDMKTGQPAAGVQVVPVDVNENGIADPEEEIDTREKTIAAVKKGIFPHPLAGVEYFVTKGKPEGLKIEFIRWALADGQKYLDDAGYIALPGETLEDELREIE
ncbi:MAG: substrate-binding domain-containing protein, partial [Candidatus Methanoperedens sp.]|nr:substrate-binding domain-containing protein [Candidatus Methanoperedens sp.]